MNGLPNAEEFSIQGILSAIKEDIEGDLNTISEILGRSRFMLADQYDLQLPPQGEITMRDPLSETADGTIVNDSAHVDDVVILHEDASLVEGSNTSSRAYRLMERLQVVPRPIRMQSDAIVSTSVAGPEVLRPVRTHSSPAVILEESNSAPVSSVRLEHFTGSLRTIQRTAARPILSDNTFAADVDGAIVLDSGFDGNEHISRDPLLQSSVRRRVPHWLMPYMQSPNSWFTHVTNNTDESAEARLRSLLNR